ncbi:MULTISPECIES: type II toxin-antitoxin system death-on-curing family toxin [Spirulina sp. CCY15215]|uniref:type II toxin-antitoxin system death-on-curing family toxin n=1 Tax=Spirulina sp. CCY15215 TaxID=2767591 RepID=UPI001951CF89
MNEPYWLSNDVVLVIHAKQIEQHGGSAGVRDENLLSASLARPKHLFAYEQPNLFELAAAYGYGIAKNHPFIDGNKRTAFAAAATFLLVNNYLLDAPEQEAIAMMEGLACDRETQASLAQWLTNNSQIEAQTT